MSQRSARRGRQRPPVQGGWSTALSEPIVLEDGTILHTLGEAGRFIADLQARPLSHGLNEVAGALLVAYETPTPANVERATHRVSAGLFFNRLLKRQAG